MLGGGAIAQETDAIATLDNLLAAKGKFPLAKETCKNHCNGKADKFHPLICVIRGGASDDEQRAANTFDDALLSFREGCDCELICDPHLGYLGATDAPDLLISSTSYAQPVYTDLPLRTHVHRVLYKNCSSLTQNIEVSLQLTATEQQTFRWSRSVAKTKKFGFTANFKFEWAGIGAGLGLSADFTKTVTMANEATNSTTDSVVRNVRFPISVPAKSRVVAEGLVGEFPATVVMTATALVDAPVTKNIAGYSNASDLLSAAERTIQLEAELGAVKATDIVASTYEFPLSESECSLDSKSLTTTSQSFVVDGFVDEDGKDQNVWEDIGASQDDEPTQEPDDPGSGVGGFCSATNDNSGATCSISCPVGEAASCDPNNGGDWPSCSCG
jgi:hypothetical protein